MDQAVQIVGLMLSVFGAMGWVFKVWIINPLNMAIGQLNINLTKIEAIVSTIQSNSTEQAQRLALAEASVKSAHKRIDELTERLREVEHHD